MAHLRLDRDCRIESCDRVDWQPLIGQLLLGIVHPEEIPAVRAALHRTQHARTVECVERVALAVPDRDELWTLRLASVGRATTVSCTPVAPSRRADDLLPNSHTHVPQELAIRSLLPVLRRLTPEAIYAIRERLLPIAVPGLRERAE